MTNPFDRFDAPKGNAFDRFDSVEPAKAAPYKFQKDVGAALLTGAGAIGATLLAPKDALEARLAKMMGADLPAPDRRGAMEDAARTMGSDTDSLTYKVAQVVPQIAGTMGIGGILAKGAAMIPGFASKAPAAIEALRTAGFSTGSAPVGFAAKAGDLALRSGAGAAVGGASVGMVNPEDVGMGAAIGGALPGAMKVAGLAGRGIKSATQGATKHSLGMSTGTGGESIGAAYRAGKDGGTKFLDNMRGNVPFTDVLDDAKSALTQMRMDRSAQYKQGMAGVSADKTVIDFAPIDKAIGSLQSMGNYKGQVINKNASGTVDEISGLVSQWKGLDPKEFHTPEGLDALKQAISDVRDTTQFGTAGRKAADMAYNAVKGEIVSQAPTYSKVMKDYTQASELLKEVERALSLGNKASADTSMRKLQSLMRNNVNTNYGNRLDLARQLEQKGGADILPAVAGQALSSWTPRGLAGLSASGFGGAAMLTSNPAALAALPLTSPRVVGEMAYGLGAMNRGISNASSASARGLGGLLGVQPMMPLTLDRFAPLLASAPVLSTSQR